MNTYKQFVGSGQDKNAQFNEEKSFHDVCKMKEELVAAKRASWSIEPDALESKLYMCITSLANWRDIFFGVFFVSFSNNISHRRQFQHDMEEAIACTRNMRGDDVRYKLTGE